MAWCTVVDSRGRDWAFDPAGAAQLVRSSQFNRQMVLRSKTIQRSNGFLLPTTTEVETDFNGLRQKVNEESTAATTNLGSEVAGDPEKMYEWLVLVRSDGESAGNAHRQMVRDASQATARAIGTNVSRWETAESAAKFVRDASAGVLFIGATVLSGGAALAVGGAATGLTFTGNTQDNLAQNQTMRQAMGNAAISTSFAVVTNLLIPKGLSAVGKGITGVNAAGQAARNLTMGENVALGLVSVQANIASDMVKTVLTADATSGTVASEASRQLQRQLGARSGFEVGSMLFTSWLASRGIPAVAVLNRNADAASSMAGGMLNAIGDRLVAAVNAQNASPQAGRTDLDMAFANVARIASAEQYVREVALRPA